MTSYKSANILSSLAKREYQIESTYPSGDKYVVGITTVMISIVTAKINMSMMDNMAPN